MKKLIGAVLIGTMAVSLMTGCSPSGPAVTRTTETTKQAEARPQDDYYRYINEERLKNAKFEYGATEAGSAFDSKLVDEQIETVIKDVVKGSGYEAGTEEDIIKKAYNAYLAYDFSKEPIPQDLTDMINEVKNAKSVDELMKLDAKIYRDYGVVSILNLAVEDNYFANDSVLSFGQINGMSDADFKGVRDDNAALDSIVTTTKTNLMTLGYDEDTATDRGRKLANLVLKIYGSTDLEILDGKNKLEYISICNREEVEQLLSNVDLKEHIKIVGYDESHCDKFMVEDKTQLKCFNSILTDENLEELKALKINDIYSVYIKFIAPHYKELGGDSEASNVDREKQAVGQIKQYFKNQTDPIYIERYYKKEVDVALRSMCDEIKEGYRKLITNAEWLSEPTRKGLLKKLDNIIYLTGTDVVRQDKAKFASVSGNYYELNLKFLRIGVADTIESLKKPRDRRFIGMAMQTMNAGYSPLYNSIAITVAITNAPFFSTEADHYTNLGGLGSIIAHEMGHAFDSNNIVYDQDGIYNPKWFSDEDRQALNARNEKAVSYFEDNYIVFGIHHVNGKMTLGENYADLGGMECVTSLAKNKEDLEKIFKSYALIWGSKQVDTGVINQINHDVHSPNIIRVNAILATLNCFYDLYGVKEGDKMYIAPEKRISRWY